MTDEFSEWQVMGFHTENNSVFSPLTMIRDIDYYRIAFIVIF